MTTQEGEPITTGEAVRVPRNRATRNREYYYANREVIAAKQKEKYKNNPDPAKERSRKWLIDNPERAKQTAAAYRQANSEKIAIAKKKCYTAKRDHYIKSAADWRSKNLDRSNASMKAWAQNNRDKTRASIKKWKDAHREQVRAECLAYAKKWAADNPELAKQKNKAWRKANPGKLRAQLRRRYGLTTTGEHYTLSDVERLYSAQSGLCANRFCAKFLNGKFHADHKIPLSRSGSNGAENIQLLCPSCNVRKGVKTMEEFIAYQIQNGSVMGRCPL